MSRIIVIITLICINAYSQNFESRVFGGVTLPIGAELGFIGETDLPNTEMLKVFTKASLCWAPVLSNKKDVNSMLIAGFQPGFRLKLMDEKFMISGGLSVNPIMPLPFDGMKVGFGTFFGVGTRINNVEIGLYPTLVFSQKIGWLSLTISKAITKNRESK